MCRQLYVMALLSGISGLGFTFFMAATYYLHLLNLPDRPINVVRYEVWAHSTAAIMLSLSVAFGSVALAVVSERKSGWLMLASTVSAVFGYLPPCERLLKLGYADALKLTILISTINVAFLLVSALALHMLHKAQISHYKFHSRK